MCIVRTADKWTTGHFGKPQFVGNAFPPLKFFGCDIPSNRQVGTSGLQILPDGQKATAGVKNIGKGAFNLF